MSHDHKTPAHNDERHNGERNRDERHRDERHRDERHSDERSRGSNRDRSQPPTLRERMLQDLQLRGMAERTQQGYLREVRKLAAYYNTPPDRLSEQQVADYLLYLINDCEFAPGSLRVAYSGLKFFYVHLTDVKEEEGRRMQDHITQPGALFDDLFPPPPGAEQPPGEPPSANDSRPSRKPR